MTTTKENKKMKAYSIASAAANLLDRGQKAIWQDKVTGAVYFCDFEDLPRASFPKEGYVELSELELLEQESKRVHW
jgi:hypothetical protein